MLVIKDFTSILSMDRNMRGSVLAALREIYDGHWERNVGTDGGQTLTWEGRITVVAAVTTAWDSRARRHQLDGRPVRHHPRRQHQPSRAKADARPSATPARKPACAPSLRTPSARCWPPRNRTAPRSTEADEEKLLALADVVTFARTAVETDYRGDVLDAHAPEMPTRFAKQLFQVVRGAEAIGLDHAAAMRLAIRCAHDSMPPFRLQILCDIAEHPEATTAEIRGRINKPLSTVKRQLEGLQVLGLLTARKEDEGLALVARPITQWRRALYYLRQLKKPEK